MDTIKLSCVFFAMASALLLASCASLGPQKAKVDAINYGDVIQQAQSEQLLRNIVHRSYGEPPSYVKISSITSSYSLSSTFAANPSASQTFGGGTSAITGTLGLSPGVTYSDSPTISYSPIDDASIVTLLEQPITFKQISLLMSNGTNFMQFMGDVGFLDVGTMHNGYGGATRAEVVSATSFDNYRRFTQTIQHMVQNGTAINSMVDYGGVMGLWTQFSSAATNSAEALLIKQLLHVPLNSRDFICLTEELNVVEKSSPKRYVVKPSIDLDDDNLVSVRMRSISSIIDFLSHTVRVPESDLKTHFTVQVNDSSGRPYAYSPALDNTMIIYSSATEPKNVLVKTFMHNSWFYIKMSDANSKYTFDMLLKLMTLALGVGSSNKATLPQITIPVGSK